MARAKRAKAQTTEDFIPLAGAFDALRDPSRVHVMALLSDGSARTVKAIVDELSKANKGDGLSQPTVSHHLRVLHSTGLLNRDRRGQFVWYSIEGAEVLALADQLVRWSGLAASVADRVAG